MEKENCVLEKKEVPNKKKNTRKTIVFGIVFVFAILFVILLIMMMNDSKKENGNSSIYPGSLCKCGLTRTI